MNTSKWYVSVLVGLIFLFPIGVQADSNSPEMKINASFETYYKSQTNYRTALDTYAGTGVRHGANNRASQITRAHGGLEFIGLAGDLNVPGNPSSRQFIAYAKISMDANDPDKSGKTDGDVDQKIEADDIWIRYAPHAAVGIKIGKQTIKATANAAITGKYVGDKDDDFIYYTAGALNGYNGIAIDAHVNENIEFGYGKIQGMGDGSQIATGGSAANSMTSVYWLDIDYDFLQFQYANQSISAGGTEDENTADGIKSKFKNEYSHTVTNYMIKGHIAGFSPFFGMQILSGDKATDSFNFNTATNKATALAATGGALGSQVSSAKDESRSMKATFSTIGLGYQMDKLNVSIEQTSVDSPAYGESDYIPALVELKSARHLQISYEIENNVNISLFSHNVTSQKDSNLRSDISAFDTIDATITAFEAYTAALEQLQWTSTSSSGIAFSMKY